MAFESVDHLLKVIEQQPQWAAYRRYRHLCQVWVQIIDPQIASHTRPLSIHRNRLWVATSSAVWAQHLSLQRYSLLQRINTYLVDEPITDILFSSAQWYNPQPSTEHSSESSHPSEIDFSQVVFQEISQGAATTPEEAFYRWTQVIEARSQALPLCPQCHCPTPPGELQRWSLCQHCATQQWSTNSPSSHDSTLD